MSATDNGRIDEIIGALQFLGKEKLICYSEEIEWLTELKQRLANSEWKNAMYEQPTKSGLTFVMETSSKGRYQKILYYNSKEKKWYDNEMNAHWRNITHWMPLPEEPKNK